MEGTLARYGITYKGSKRKIADDILNQLPPGKRLVDLFGGGFAITDCAMRKFGDKWDEFYYNDIDPLLPRLISDAIDGKYNYDRFHPWWVSREEFAKRKESDGYVKFLWSFGGSGCDYFCSRKAEDAKRKIFEFIVNGAESDVTDGITLDCNDIRERRIECKNVSESNRIVPLERLERMQHLSELDKSRLVLDNISYDSYEYHDGDVVYCDIPYADSKNKYKDYGGRFDHDKFFEWAYAQPFTVYYSSYTKGDVLWQKTVTSVMNSGSGAVKRTETLFAI